MTCKLALALVCACLVLSCTFASAQSPIFVTPNPINFGIVDEYQTGTVSYVYFNNTTSSPVTINTVVIAGTNSADFAIGGDPCTGTYSAGSYCETFLTFTPSAMGARSAELQVTIAGQTSPLNVPLQGTGGNPLPAITTLSPPTGYAGSSGVKLTITGTGFVSSSVVYFGNATIPTTYVNATKLTAQVPAVDLTSAGSEYVAVSSPAPGGGSSASTYFQVVSDEPSISTLSPNALTAGAATSQVVVNGNNFMSTATVLWNGVAVPTTFVNSQELEAQVSAADLATAAIVPVSVSNPSPGVISAALPFNITYAATITVLDLPANDLVWDPFNQVIYASLPSSYGSNGNSIAVINPAAGTVTGYHYVGSEPNQLALSGNSNYLYVGLNGSGSVQRLDIPSFAKDINVDLSGTSVYEASELAVSPTNAHQWVVNLEQNGCCENGPLEFFTDATKLNAISNTAITQLVFASAATLYGYGDSSLSEIAVSSTGGTVSKTVSGYLEGPFLQYDAGLLYSSYGQVFNPTTGLLTGTFDVGSTSCCSGFSGQLLPETSINRVFALGTTPFFDGFGITSYNSTEFLPIAVTNLEAIYEQYGNIVTTSPILWGSNGAAFLIQNGCCGEYSTQVILLQSPTMFLTDNSTTKTPSVTSLSPDTATHGSGNFKLTIEGSNFFPGSQVSWNGKRLAMTYMSSTKLIAYVPASAIANSGPATVVVTNPPVKAGLVTSANFTIN